LQKWQKYLEIPKNL
jgi:hypothetical protein